MSMEISKLVIKDECQIKSIIHNKCPHNLGNSIRYDGWMKGYTNTVVILTNLAFLWAFDPLWDTGDATSFSAKHFYSTQLDMAI